MKDDVLGSFELVTRTLRLLAGLVDDELHDDLFERLRSEPLIQRTLSVERFDQVCQSRTQECQLTGAQQMLPADSHGAGPKPMVP